ncbi:hypothetical protein [Lacinutrix sp. MEBiC02595]
MKKILLTILFIAISSKILACMCNKPNITQRIAQSDFVATAKILKVTPNSIKTIYDNVEIEIIEIYKGKATTTIKTMSYGSCGFSVSENSTWLIFATKDTNGNLSFGYCSGAKQIDRKFNSVKYPNAKEQHDAGIKYKLELLNFIKDKKILPKNEFNISAMISPSEHFNSRNFVYSNESTKTAIRPILFELTINTDLSIKRVKILQNLKDKSFKKNLKRYIKENIRIIQKEKLLEIPNKTKIIFQI